MKPVETMSDSEFKEYIKSVDHFRGLKKDSFFSKKILQYTKNNNLFNEETTIQTYLYYIRNDIKNIPQCIVCNKQIVNLAKGANRLQKFCSKKCQGSSQITGNWPEKIDILSLSDFDVVQEIKARPTCKNITKSEKWNARLSLYINSNTEINSEQLTGEEKIHIIKRDLKAVPKCDNCKINHVSISPRYNNKDETTRLRFQSLCWDCHTKTSNYEKIIRDCLCRLNTPYEKNTRAVLNNKKELDIYLPEQKIGIEINGLYWHSEAQNIYNKLEDCNKQEIRLLQIFTDEIDKSLDIVFFRLRNILQKVKYKIGARVCVVKKIDNVIKNKFLNKYHIQGADKSQINLGLFWKNRLVSVMTFARPRRVLGYVNMDAGWELSRFASINSFYILGAAGKLFKGFIELQKPTRVYSYCDLRWSQGDVYKKIGFKFVKNTVPNYWYCLGPSYKERHHRFNFRKSVLNKKLKHFDSKLTEVQNMYNNKHYRVFDSGHMLFDWTAEY